jgi:hypothetical protein
VPTILRRLPFYEHPTILRVPGGPVVDVLSHQTVIWVSVTRPGLPALPADARRFPVVLDTGFNGNLLIPESQLVGGAGVARRGCAGWTL